MELNAELTCRDGSCRPFQVSCDRNLKGLIKSLEQIKGEVSAALTDLVIREKGDKSEDRESAGEEDEDTEDEDNSENGICSNDPPIKRNKMQQD